MNFKESKVGELGRIWREEREEENIIISQIIILKKLKICQDYRLYICRKYKSETYIHVKIPLSLIRFLSYFYLIKFFYLKLICKFT